MERHILELRRIGGSDHPESRKTFLLTIQGWVAISGRRNTRLPAVLRADACIHRKAARARGKLLHAETRSTHDCTRDVVECGVMHGLLALGLGLDWGGDWNRDRYPDPRIPGPRLSASSGSDDRGRAGTQTSGFRDRDLPALTCMIYVHAEVLRIHSMQSADAAPPSISTQKRTLFSHYRCTKTPWVRPSQIYSFLFRYANHAIGLAIACTQKAPSLHPLPRAKTCAILDLHARHPLGPIPDTNSPP